MIVTGWKQKGINSHSGEIEKTVTLRQLTCAPSERQEVRKAGKKYCAIILFIHYLYIHRVKYSIDSGKKNNYFRHFDLPNIIMLYSLVELNILYRVT